MRHFFLIILFLLQGCSPSNREEWRLEGISIVRVLVKELEGLDSFAALEKRQKSIKKKYLKLVDIIIEADSCIDDDTEVYSETFYSDALRRQYVRLFKIEGCRELLLSIQKEGLHKLDRHARRP